MKNDYDPTQMNLDEIESSNEGQAPVGCVIPGRKGNHSKTKILKWKARMQAKLSAQEVIEDACGQESPQKEQKSDRGCNGTEETEQASGICGDNL